MAEAGAAAPDRLCGARASSASTAPDGSLRCARRVALAPHDPSLARLFRAAVERNPAGLFLAERDAGGAWRKLTYEQARQLVDALAQALLERGLSRRAAGDDPLRQRHRPRAAHARRPHRRHSGRADLGRLFAAEPGPRQAQAHRRAARRPASSTSPTPRPFAKALAALDLADVEIVASRNGANRDGVTQLRAAGGRAAPAPRRRAGGRRDRRRHHRQIPVHLGLDRPAQGRRSTPTAC